MNKNNMDKQILELLIDMHNTIKKIHLSVDGFKHPTFKVGKKGGLPGYFIGSAGSNGESGPLWLPNTGDRTNRHHGSGGQNGIKVIAKKVITS